MNLSQRFIKLLKDKQFTAEQLISYIGGRIITQQPMSAYEVQLRKTGARKFMIALSEKATGLRYKFNLYYAIGVLFQRGYLLDWEEWDKLEYGDISIECDDESVKFALELIKEGL